MLDIRNFSIIAHIDHGKSTLSDCLIQFCGGLQQRDMRFRVLDSMDLERERGITIKAQCVTLSYTALNGLIYRMNFIDTPGHVDFSYEVSRSLFACEGVLLLVDSTQGVQAQTLANARMALEMNLVIVLVLNKIDLFTSDIKGVCRQVEDLIGIDTTNVVLCSAKNGTGISNILENLVKYIPSPTGNPSASLQALIIDAWFDNYCGVVFLVCIKNGILRKGDKVKFMSTDRSYFIDKLGVFTPKSVERKVLYCGEVGWFVCVIKDVFSSLVGDTLTSYLNSSVNVLPSFKRITPKVYSSFFITDSSLQNNFRLAIHKLSLNDSSFSYEPENSPTFGFGFRCGFLGTLHMEVVQARLEREYSLTLIRTTPTVVYEVLTSKGDVMYLNSAEKFLSKCCIKEIREPIVKCNIFLQQEHIGDVISLCVSRRGKNVKIISYSEQIILTCYLPMAEVMLGFFNHVKSITHGYG